ncbi:hypothetical protein AVEN_158887-1 [Araneus ventricosus]|uniref:Uncharacterized protein n=1 Tax=Araneus ventricosus TaxID=182803 RepID=A0A4Y2B8M7_ARAVE|nr:hypothetical protein AVEN_158887-1 [Araneus ventricosus]
MTMHAYTRQLKYLNHNKRMTLSSYYGLYIAPTSIRCSTPAATDVSFEDIGLLSNPAETQNHLERRMRQNPPSSPKQFSGKSLHNRSLMPRSRDSRLFHSAQIAWWHFIAISYFSPYI